MIDLSFIRYKLSKSIAQDLGESIEVERSYLGQIQLIPNDKQPVWQVTNTDFDFNVGAYVVSVVDNCTGVEIVVTDSVQITNFTDDNGVVQAKIRYVDISVDFGANLVYFKIEHNSAIPSFSSIYYSNLLLITENNEELTTRIDYIDKPLDVPTLGTQGFIQSIRLGFYFKNKVSQTELDAYYQISTEQNINSRILENNLSQWYVQPINAWTFRRMENAMYNGSFWFNQVRNYITSPAEYNLREELSNISEQTIITDPNEDDFLNIIEVTVDPSMVPMLASSSRLCSSSQLISEETTPA